jgi:hypothetical protein
LIRCLSEHCIKVAGLKETTVEEQAIRVCILIIAFFSDHHLMLIVSREAEGVGVKYIVVLVNDRLISKSLMESVRV